MTNVKFNGVPFERTFNNLVGDLITDLPGLFKNDGKPAVRNGFAPVNITEKEKEYQIEVAAPGFEKTDFKINLDEKILTVAAQTSDTESVTTDKVVRKEFAARSFKRSFTIDENLDTEKIDAKYVNGILILTIQKKENIKKASKDIEVL